MSKVSKISNTCAGIIGGVIAYFAQDIQNEQIKAGLLSLIPPSTLFLAYLFKILGNMAALGTFNRLLNSKAESQLDELRTALSDKHLSDDMKKKLLADYEETYSIKLDVKKKDLRELNKASEGARNELATNVQKGYQDNPELQQQLAAESPSKDTQ